MNATYSENLATPFVVGADELARLEDLLETHVGDVSVSAECADSVSRTFSGVDALLQYDNPRSKEILSLNLSARCDDFTAHARIGFSGSRWRGATLYFSADEDAVIKLKTGSLDVLDGARPWYSVVQGVDFVAIGFIALFLLWLSVIARVASMSRGRQKRKASQELTHRESANGQLVLFGILAAIFAVGILFNWLRDSLFPRAVFLIGQGISRFEVLERIHWGFLMAITASVIGGILILASQVWHNKAVNASGGSDGS